MTDSHRPTDEAGLLRRTVATVARVAGVAQLGAASGRYRSWVSLKSAGLDGQCHISCNAIAGPARIRHADRASSSDCWFGLPTCRCRVPARLTPAERQRAYRRRKREKSQGLAKGD
jgi:hypothetical protein